ncbi:MAG: amidohydrolase family protein [Caulobacteraceae bacterium]|nr:amidohydrolase family protein [Caulobacteraceae bacterium]
MRRAAILVLAATLLATGARAQSLAIVHAKAYATPGAPPVEDATILVRDGRIQAVGAGLAPPAGAQVVDAHGAVVTPGLMNAATQLGVLEVASTDDAVDQAVKSGPLGAAFDVEYALNANSGLIAVARADGLTRAISLPTGSAGAPFAGQGAALRLSEGGDILDRPRIAMAAVVGGMTSGQAGGSRAAQWRILRNALDEARAYGAGRRGLAPRDQLLNHLDAEALAPVLDGRMPLAITAQRESDIRQAIALAADYRLKVVIVGGAEAWRVAGLLAQARIPVVLDPFADLPYTLDQIGARLDNAAILDKAGVTIAFALTDGLSSVYNNYLAGEALREGAGLAVANGLGWDAALKAVTTGPARIWGLADHYGTLAAGQDADLVIWHGDPLDVSGWPDAVFVRGEAVSLRTRQSELRDRYAPGHAGDAWPSDYRR